MNLSMFWKRPLRTEFTKEIYLSISVATFWRCFQSSQQWSWLDYGTKPAVQM